MPTPREQLTDALARLTSWDGDDTASIEGAVDALATAVRAFAEVPPEETRGPEALAMLAGANATTARALSLVLEAKLRAESRSDRATASRHESTGRKLREATAQLARESAARIKP